MARACLPLSLWRHQCTQLGVSQGATTFQRSSAHVTYGPQGAPRHPGWKPAPTTSPDLQGMLYRQRPQLIFVCASDRVVLISPGKAVGAGGGRYFSHYTSFSQGYMGLTDPYEIHSPTQCPAQPSRKAQHVLHGLIAYQRLVCWQVRERGKRGAASSHYFSTGCLPGASEGTGRLAYICYPLLWLQTDLRTDFFCLFLLFK